MCLVVSWILSMSKARSANQARRSFLENTTVFLLVGHNELFFTENARIAMWRKDTGQSNEERREHTSHVGSEGVIDYPPGQGEDSLLRTLAEILTVLNQSPVIQSQVSIQVT